MIPRSIRWRLPLSYAAIALLAALALGLVLLTTLRGYYRQQELDYLTNNAQAMGAAIAQLLELDVPSTLLQSQLRSFAFLSQTRVRLLDPASQVMADSGAPQEQRGVATLVLEGEQLDIQNAEEYPDVPADVAGIFVQREDNSLFVGTGNMSGVKVGDKWEQHHDGPVVEVVTTHDTLIYRDDMLQRLGGVAPSGPVQQVLKPGSLDEIDGTSTVEAWGERRGDRLVAEVVVFTPNESVSRVLPEGEWTKVYTSTMPIVEVVQEPTSGEHITVSSENRSVPSAYVYFTSAVGTPYGFGLNAETPSEGHRSDQMVRQAFHDREGELLGYVELSEGPAYGRQILDSVTRGWAVAGGVAVLLAAGAGWMASRRITTPLLALTDVTTQMAEGDLSARADVAREDEMGLLARSFNQMASQVEGTIIALRRFVADAAHELHTPLTALRTNLELVVEEENGVRRGDFLARAQTQVARLEALTNSLLDLSRLETVAAQETRTPIDLVDLVRETSELYASRAEQAGLTFSLDLPEDPVTVRGGRAQLRQALGNLLDNAIKFTPEGGEIRVGVRQEGAWVTLWVQDTGIGIPADDLPQLFGRFHRGRNATAYPGSGLGLAIVKAVVEGHGGQVTAENPDQGMRFAVRLPTAGQHEGDRHDL